MNKNITIRLNIPVSVNEPDSYVIVFNQWMPYKEKDFLTICNDNIEIIIWFDKDCTWGISDYDELKNWINVKVNTIKVDAHIKNISDELINFIFDPSSKSQTDSKKSEQSDMKNRLENEYYELGKQVYETSLKNVNRMLSYFRNYKGQWWIQEYPIDFNMIANSFRHFHARVKVDGSDWIEWRPKSKDTMVAELKGMDRLLEETDWPDVKKYMQSANRPNLVLELLANAEYLADNEHGRNAIVEGVTAMEVAINEFSKNPNFKSFLATKQFKRLSDKSLQNLIEHYGLTGTINIFFPLFFDENSMSDKILNDCQHAIVERNNIVHNAQRKIDNSKVRQWLKSIREMCTLLGKYTLTS